MILAARAAVAVQFLNRHRLPVGVFVALGLGFGLAVGHQFSEIGGRIVGTQIKGLRPPMLE